MKKQNLERVKCIKTIVPGKWKARIDNGNYWKQTVNSSLRGKVKILF